MNIQKIELSKLNPASYNPRKRLKPGDAEKAVEEITTPVSRRGDIWLLGEHRLRCGDSTVQSEVDELMGGQRVKPIQQFLHKVFSCAYNAATPGA